MFFLFRKYSRSRVVTCVLIGVLMGLLVQPARAFLMPQCTGSNQALGYDAVAGIVCNSPLVPLTHLGMSNNISVNVGALSLGTKTVTVTGLTGLLTNDVCFASLASTQGITAGLVLSGCRASANGQADLIFATPIVLGISAGTINVNVGWIGNT